MTSIFTQDFTEIAEFAGNLWPAQRAAGAYNTAWLAMGNYQRIAFLLKVGAMGAGATVDFLLQQATNQFGAGAVAVAGKAITQLTQAGGDGNDLVIVELRTEELNVDGGFEFVRGVLTIANAAVFTNVTPIRMVANYPPVPNANVTEIVR